MSRPKYETGENRLAEQTVADTVARVWNCDVIKLPGEFAHIDRALCRGGARFGLAEIKTRTIPSWTFPKYMISADKVYHLNAAARDYGLVVWLIVGWTDRIGTLQITGQTYVKDIGGRNDRNDPKDMETMVFIPQEEFTTLATLATPVPKITAADYW